MKDALRDHLQRALDWGDAHASVDRAISGLPFEAQGTRAVGFPHTCWQLLEHLRLAQRDILDFCINPAYEERTFPDDYWPGTAAPSRGAWKKSSDAFRADLGHLKRLAADETTDLLAPIAHGSGQTILRELLLVIDHNAYHLGQLVALRRALGHWSP
jgi:uncharacterized damage-inducible protein DinB